MIQPQMCSYSGHENKKVKYICFNAECQQNKLLCSSCYIDKNHKHDNANEKFLDHIGLQVQIQLQIDQLHLNLQQVDDVFVQRCIGLIKLIQQQTNNIIDNLKKLTTKSYIQDEILNLQNKLETIKETKLNQVDENFIRQIITIDFQKNQQNILQEIRQQCESLNKNSMIMSQLVTKEKQIQYLKQPQYDTALLDQTTDSDIYSAAISNDQKYVITSRTDKVMKIWNYQDYKLIQELYLSDQMLISKFTDDSSLLYIGTTQGLLCCYDAKNNFIQTFKGKIHRDSILNLYCINNTLILTSSIDQRIIKTNTFQNKQLLVIQAHNDRIDGLDFHKSKDVIVSCSKDNFIRLWNNSNGSFLIQEKNAYESIINQVLFINNCDQLISLDSCQKVNFWQIKYDTKDLILIKTINDQNMIFNISLVLNQQFILLVCVEYIKFYTIQGEYIIMIKHDVKEFYMIRQVQLDQLESMIVQGKKQIQIFRRKI